MFEWKPGYNTDIEGIDRDHQHFFQIINKLQDAMSRGKGMEILGALLAELVDHAESHFASEERLMRKYDYPDYQTHHNQHQWMRDKINSLQQQTKNNKLLLSGEVYHHLERWMNAHIIHSDQEFSDFVKLRKKNEVAAL